MFAPIDVVFCVRARGSRGFTLVEMLVVMAIMALLASILLLAVAGFKGSQDISKSSSDIQGVLEQARSLAMADDTYVWIGFFEENPSTPGTAGTGQVVISVVSSSDGTQLFTNGNPPTSLPATGLIQVNKLMKLPNLHLVSNVSPDIISTTAVPRPTVSGTYQVGSSSFSNNITFAYPIGGSQYQFSNVIQFNPQGDATRIGSTPTQLMEIGLCPARGSTALSTNKNLIAIQIAGIGGHVSVYRP